MNGSVTQEIDYAIKRIWMNEIADDYKNSYLLKEDSLKNAFYHHLRNSLDPLFKKNQLKIYTEFNEKGLKARGLRADIAIVQIDMPKEESYYLGDLVNDVLAIIELKHKGKGSFSTSIIQKDIEKTRNYIKDFRFQSCQYYLGFIHEYSYPLSEMQWLNKRQSNSWAKGRITELNACYFDEHEEDGVGFSVCSHNGLNMELDCRDLNKIRFVSMESWDSNCCAHDSFFQPALRTGRNDEQG